jgi:hypothetical protein
MLERGSDGRIGVEDYLSVGPVRGASGRYEDVPEAFRAISRVVLEEP